jgi:hypothetical protein
MQYRFISLLLQQLPIAVITPTGYSQKILAEIEKIAKLLFIRTGELH